MGNATLSVNFSILSLQGKNDVHFFYLFLEIVQGEEEIPLAYFEEDKNTTWLLCDEDVGNSSFHISVLEEAV